MTCDTCWQTIPLDRLKYADEGLCLYSQDASKFLPITRANGTRDAQGCYIMEDTLTGDKRRVGSVFGAGKTFGTCIWTGPQSHNEGAKRLNSATRNKLVYAGFPHRGIESDRKIGNFEDLKWLVGIGYKRMDPKVVRLFCEDISKGGLPHWSPSIERELQKGAGLLEDKKMEMVAYTVELVGELCLARAKNVSESGGFESRIASGRR